MEEFKISIGVYRRDTRICGIAHYVIVTWKLHIFYIPLVQLFDTTDARPFLSAKGRGSQTKQGYDVLL